MNGRLNGLRISALGLAFLLCLGLAAAEEAMDLLRGRESGRAGAVSLNYREIRFERVLVDMEKQRPGINLKLKTETFQEEQDLLAMPVTMGPLSGVTWDIALKYVADRMRLVVDRGQIADGVIYLEKVARFTDNFDGVRLVDAVREISKRGNANIVFSPRVSEQGDMPVYLSFTDVPWREALDSVLRAHNCTILYDGDGKIMRIATAAEADVIIETRSRPLRYIQPEGSHFQPEVVQDDVESFVGRKSSASDVGKSLVQVLKEMQSVDPANPNTRVSITYESRTNTLILRDTPLKIQEMLKVIDEIDIPPQQVHVETRVISVEENPTFNLGVKWGTSGPEGVEVGVDNGPSWATSWPWPATGSWGNLGNLFRPVTGGDGHPAYGGAGTGIAGYTLGRMSLTNLRFMLQAAQYDDRIEVTQAPQILVLDNEEASVFIGNVRTYALAEQTVEEGIISTSIEEKEILVGVQLFVIPHVVRGTDQIIIEIIPKQTDEPTIETRNAGDINVDIPTSMAVKTVHTKMMLHSTETGVIAGLFRNDTTEQTRSIPGLSKIPVLGKLFTHNSKSQIKVNSMVLVTPTIISPEYGKEIDSDIEAFRESLAAANPSAAPL